jgi:hypothetical protein
MYRVLDTIVHSESWTHRYPELRARGDGLLVILDPKDTTNVFNEAATQATVSVAGRKSTVLPICSVEKNRAGVVGLFFRDTKEEAVPRGATLIVT